MDTSGLLNRKARLREKRERPKGSEEGYSDKKLALDLSRGVGFSP